MIVKVSSKYQVVIPEKVRSLLGLRPGTQVDVIAKGRVAYIVPLSTIEDLQESFKGKLSTEKVRDKKDRKI